MNKTNFINILKIYLHTKNMFSFQVISVFQTLTSKLKL